MGAARCAGAGAEVKNWRRELRLEANRRAFDYTDRARVVPDMIDEAADEVVVELEQDSDPVALQRKTARLALLMAWRANGEVPK